MDETASWSAQFRAWLFFWAELGLVIASGALAYRYKLELDKPLDRRTKWSRWSVICLCWFLASLPGGPSLATGIPRATAVALGCVFLCWPNSALWVARQVWKSEFQHVEGAIRRWDPAGIVDREAMSVYSEHVPEVLDILERRAGVDVLSRKLSEIRSQWTQRVDSLVDHRTAENLVEWWRSGARHEAA